MVYDWAKFHFSIPEQLAFWIPKNILSILCMYYQVSDGREKKTAVEFNFTNKSSVFSKQAVKAVRCFVNMDKNPKYFQTFHFSGGESVYL